MKRPRCNGFIGEIKVKMKVIEVLEGRTESLSVKEVVALLKLSKSRFDQLARTQPSTSTP